MKSAIQSGHDDISSIDDSLKSLAKNGDWDAYMSAIAEHGLRWWFEMDAERIYNHCARLGSAVSPESLQPRLVFLAEWLQSVMSAEKLEGLYNLFMESRDYEAACAVAVAGVNSISIFNAGPGVKDTWYERVRGLLQRRGEISGLAVASLLGARGLTEQNRGDIAQALKTYREMRRVAEKTGSASLLVYCAADIAYPLVLMGRISELDIILMDTAPVAELPETSSISRAWFMISLGFVRLVQGRAGEGYKTLREIVKHPLFGYLPLDMRLLAMNHFILACAFTGAVKEMESFTSRILALAVPEKDFFDHAYTHFCVGVSRLATGNPLPAIRHAGRAMKIGRKGYSPVMEALGALLLGQGLADMGEQSKAMTVFNNWSDKWRKRGFNILTAGALMEMARLFTRRGEMDSARQCYREAAKAMPDGEAMPPLYRPRSFMKELDRQLGGEEGGQVGWAAPEEAYARIETFGGLRLWIDGKPVSEKEWGGKKTMQLLKAIIVYGGRSVSASMIADLLWPDADGDSAMHSLNVTLWRIRKLGVETNDNHVSWIKLRGGRLWLEAPVCYVDCLEFAESLEGLEDDDADGLRSALDIFTGDFLPEDTGEPWIDRHRNFLKEKFDKATSALLLA